MTERLRERAIVDSIGAMIRRKEWANIHEQWQAALDTDERWFIAAALRQFRAHDLPDEYNFEFEALRLESALRLGISSLVEIHLRALLRLRQPTPEQQSIIEGYVVRVLDSPATSTSFRAQLRVTNSARFGTPTAAAEALMNCGRVSLAQGHIGRAEAAFAQALSIYEQHNNTPLLSEALHQLGIAQRLLNKPDAAVASFHRAYEIGEPRQQAAALLGLADVYGAAQQYQPAEQHLQQAWTIYEQTGHVFGQADVLLGLAQLYLISGQLESAQQCLNDLRTLVASTADPQVNETFTPQMFEALENRLGLAA
ncbi:MAG: tetratricopeptide repeat protein [Anaerolineae bacterium]|nr:tetratricopeptide repeat protein [Anaerolineae bacterium]